jgi:hypothetical protein
MIVVEDRALLRIAELSGREPDITNYELTENQLLALAEQALRAYNEIRNRKS